MKKLLIITLMIVSVSLITSLNNSVIGQSVVVIVNNENPIGTMKQIEVKLYYMKKIKKIWPGLNTTILPVQRSGDSDAKTAFLSAVLKMSASEIGNYFKQRQFANAETIPVSFTSDAQIIAYVSENNGAIGYVSQSAFNSAGGKVKSVFTQ